MLKDNKKPKVFSGVQPSGNLHIGNYLGAISQWVGMQDEFDCIFCVVDYHAITVPQDPAELKKKIIEIAKIYLASGIDPKKSVIFQQSDVKEHAELAWILNTITRMSDLYRMTQFKDKSGNQENAGVGLFDYPVLMAADILLYNTDVVPVGEDQEQHVELARDLAKRFNHQFGETFKIPVAQVRKETARIMGLDDPSKKMSKSAKSEYNRIGLLDDPEAAARKIQRAVTDSGSEIVYDPHTKPAVSNLLSIHTLLSGRQTGELEKSYRGKGYGELKKDLSEEVKKFLQDFQDRYRSISDDEVKRILSAGADTVRPLAAGTISEAKRAIGVTL